MKRYVLIMVALCTSLVSAKEPKVTVVFVIDQLAYHEVLKLKPFLTGGIKFLMEQGINYTMARHPHGVPETAIGHTTIGTATLAKDHGIVSNVWCDKNGAQTNSDHDTSLETAGVFAPDGSIYPSCGKSAKNIMVDTLSDQVMLASQPTKKYHAIAISHKSRAAIPLAGKLGTAFWLDIKSGNFTSSKAYVPQLPDWLRAFNKEKNVSNIQKTVWELAYPNNKKAYSFVNINNYKHTGSWGFEDGVIKLAGKTIEIKKNQSSTHLIDPHASTNETCAISLKGPYELFAKTPEGSQYLFDLGKTIIDEYVDKTDHLLLWVAASSLDKLGHPFGPESLEAVDIIYHLDLQIKDFMNYVQKKTGHNVVFALTADHGILPIPELIKERGYTPARRIFAPDLITKMNTYITHHYGVENIISYFKSNEFYVNRPKFNKLSKEKRVGILRSLKKYLKQHPGIKNVWTFNELKHMPYRYELGDIEGFYKNQLFRGRSGDLICQVYPYCLLTDRPEGTAHSAPYNYDTHVPLLLYRKGIHEHKTITKPVWVPQFTCTLAYILGVQQPSASLFPILPGLETKESHLTTRYPESE